MTSPTIATRARTFIALAAATALAALTFTGQPPAAAADGPAASEPAPAELTLRGFLRGADGEFAVAEPPGATLTKPLGLNNRGDIVFKYLVADGTQLGARLSRGIYRPVAVPGAVVTAPLGQNDKGEVVGNYFDANGVSHGFHRSKHGRYTTIDHPDASGTVLGTPGTIVSGINNRGEMVGIYARDGRMVGFLRDRWGRLTTVDRRGAAATYLADINDRGQVVGDSSEVGADELLGGIDGAAFIFERGRFTPLEVTGARAVFVNGINNRGQMVGTYVDSDGASHAFLQERRRRTSRTITIDHPDDGNLGTVLYSINDRGQTTGAYLSEVEPDDAGAVAIAGAGRAQATSRSGPMSSAAGVAAP
jgi:hypothetical protein